MKQSEIKQLLPAVIQRTVRPGKLMSAFLHVMEDLHAPSEDILQKIDAVFDPYRTADRFIPFLAAWVDMDYVLGGLSDEEVLSASSYAPRMGCMRNLIANAAFLAQWRGTRQGLLAFLELATGIKGFKIDEDVDDDLGRPKPFHLKIGIPAAAEGQFTDLIERIVNREKPIYVTYELDPLVFTITTTAEDLKADDSGKASTVFTVTSNSSRPIKATAKTRALGNTEREWLSIEGQTEIELSPGGSQQFKVNFHQPPPPVVSGVAPPPPEKFPFRLDVASPLNPDKKGPRVSVEVAPPKSK